MRKQHTALVFTLALTACVAQEPASPPPGVPALPALPVEPGISHPIQLAQAHPVPVSPKGDIFFSRSKAGRSLIIQLSDPDPKTYANIEEDLSVMHRILSKARKQDESGFRLESFLSGSSGSSVKSMYIEGYGALFMLNVRFPLVAPQAPDEQPKPKETTSEEWERARRELSARNSFEIDLERAWTHATMGPAGEEYDAQKVEDLTVSVLESLKNATHIRNLKADEFVTIAILGAEGSLHRVSVENEDSDGKNRRKARVEAAAPRGESTMTIRVRKSDVDDFAKGKLNLDAFRKKAKMLVYTRPGDPSARMNIIAAPTPPRQ